MAVYVAQKPCSFAGKDFKIGDMVPAELIQPGAAPALMKMGLIANTTKDAAPVVPETTGPVVTTVDITVPVEEGRLALDITKEGLQSIVDVLCANVEGAEKIIDEMIDNDALILLHIVDNRKSIKTAAQERAETLNTVEESEEGEQ